MLWCSIENITKQYKKDRRKKAHSIMNGLFCVSHRIVYHDDDCFALTKHKLLVIYFTSLAVYISTKARLYKLTTFSNTLVIATSLNCLVHQRTLNTLGLSQRLLGINATRFLNVCMILSLMKTFKLVKMIFKISFSNVIAVCFIVVVFHVVVFNRKM